MVVLVAATALGCAPEADLLGDSPPPEAVTSGIFNAGESARSEPSLVREYWDCRGRVQTAVWVCHTTSAAEVHTVTCPVKNSDYVAVGGGAWVPTGQDFPGAFIIDQRVVLGSRAAFRASSKSHDRSHPHQLMVFVFGLKLLGVPRDQLVSNLSEVHGSTIANSTPETWFDVPSGRILLSGSVFVPWFQGSGPGHLLVGSWGSGSSWGVRSKDHIHPQALDTSGFATSIASSVGGIDLVGVESGTAVSVNSGVAEAKVAAPRMALTGIGAWASYNGPGRMLFKIAPSLDGQHIVVQSKDHLHSDGGTTWVNALGLRERTTGVTRCVVPVPTPGL